MSVTYYVVGLDGQRYGPADMATLQKWALEGRVLPTMMLEEAGTGAVIPATGCPGLFPTAPQFTSNYPRTGVLYTPRADPASPWIAAILGVLLIGLGQAYNRQYVKGLVLFFAAVFGACACLPIAPILWVYGIVDAVMICQRANRGEPIGPWTC